MRERIIDKKKPMIIRNGAKLVNLKATSWAVMVVPTLLPKIMPTLCLNDNTPALTRLIVITEVAELDWITAVTKAPINTPTNGNLVALLRDFRKCSPETRSISLEKFSSPNINKMMAVMPAMNMDRLSIGDFTPFQMFCWLPNVIV